MRSIEHRRDAIELNEFITDLEQQAISELRRRWVQEHPESVLPQGLSRDLLIRGISWQHQCRSAGGAPKKLLRQLDSLAGQLKNAGTLDLEREARLKPGTRIVREWRGKTWRVEVVDHGFEIDGQLFASLSQVARYITGTRWSGPRFFGLRTNSQGTKEAV